MKIAISQPTYLPWLGYFDLIDEVDSFVVLDNVQFEKQSWQQRNRIKTPTGLQWLTVPVQFRGRLGQKILEVEIREAEFWRKHLRAIELNYARAAYFNHYFAELTDILKNYGAGSRLVDVNLSLLNWLLKTLDIRTPVLRASSLGEEGKRTELLANICQNLGATQYLSPLGSAVYLLSELSIFSSRNVEARFQNYTHPEYKQLFPPFISYACVLDVIFNEGPRSLEVIRSGRGEPFPPEQVAATVAECKTI